MEKNSNRPDINCTARTKARWEHGLRNNMQLLKCEKKGQKMRRIGSHH